MKGLEAEQELGSSVRDDGKNRFAILQQLVVAWLRVYVPSWRLQLHERGDSPMEAAGLCSRRAFLRCGSGIFGTLVRIPLVSDEETMG